MSGPFLRWGELCRDLAARHGTRPAFVDGRGRSVSFAAFNQRVNRFNQALAGRGVARGERVAILARNCIEYVETYGLAKTGLLVVPLNWRLAGAEILRLLEHCQPTVLVVDEHFLPLIESLRARAGAESLAAIRHFIRIGSALPPPGWLDYEVLLAAATDEEPVLDPSLDPEGPLCLMYTSGTTGMPKGVQLTHRALLSIADRVGREVLHLTPADRSLCAMPLFHVGGMWYHLHVSFAAGATSCLLPGFDAAEVAACLRSWRITNVHLVPTMVAALLETPALAAGGLPGLRLIFYAASPMPAPLLARAMARFPGVGFLQSYGATETGLLTVLDPADHQPGAPAERLASCGRAVAGVRLRVVDGAGEPLPAGAVGEVQLASRNHMAGYYRDGEATAAAFAGAWLRTGDMGWLDAAGYLYLVDRKNDMIITGGENVYPSEVEQALYQDPAVRLACVFGVPDEKWVERVVACVVLQPGRSETGASLLSRLRRVLAPYKCPKEVMIQDNLPMNAVGKILKRELRRLYAEGNFTAANQEERG